MCQFLLKRMKKKSNIYKNCIKRLLDCIFAAAALVILSPFIGIAALLVRVKLGSPVIFKQARPGKDEKIFRLYKFRSMTNAVDQDGKLLPDAQRLTKFGRLIRKTSVDELPELVNIIKGDMSIVGPRPLSIYYLPHYPKNLRRRHEVRPGLTGLAQVNGRNNLLWEDRFAFDLEYVENVSFMHDLKIILSTFGKVAKGSDVAVRGTAKIGDYGTYCTVKEEKAITQKRKGMTYSEIGSYFWLEERQLSGKDRAAVPENNAESRMPWLPKAEDALFTFSGRAAIEMVLLDLLKQKKNFKVWVPSYSCVSMLQSFIDHDIPYSFYDVSFQNGGFCYDLESAGSGDVVLIMSYFGLETKTAHEWIGKLRAKGAVVIEDITHSLFCETPASQESDYLVASLRKWMELPSGGWAGKRSGTFAVRPNLDSDHTVEERIRAMQEKYAYLQGKTNEKEGYLSTLSKCDNDLIHTDRMLKMDSLSCALLASADISEMKRKRRGNAAALRSGLADLADGGLILPEPDTSVQTPLFYPVFLPEEKRESLRRHLIQNGMYCPVHWPEVMGAAPGIRKNELSLICDQRYSLGDMQAICSCIHEWFASPQ